MSIHVLSQEEKNEFIDGIFLKALLDVVSEDLSLRTDLEGDDNKHAQNNGKIRAILNERPNLDLNMALNGKTLLTTAVSGRNTKAVELLLENGASPEQQNDLGHSPMDIALKTSQPKMLNLLGKHGADLTTLSANDTRTNGIDIKAIGTTPTARSIPL